jgi:hypothetical protein
MWPFAGDDAPAAPRPIAQAAPADTFFRRVAALCGQAFEGHVTVDSPTQQGMSPFNDKRLIMHVRACSKDTVRIPFLVGEDRSRTWVLTRTATGLSLKHDHRHEDGSEDALSMYGGDSRGAGTVKRQEFPADDESKALFEREDRAVSITNVWAIEIEPGDRFVYELSRPGRLFRVEFDLTRPIPAPPSPWGWTD